MIASALRRRADAICLLSHKKLVENCPKWPQKVISRPFCRSKSTRPQVLNFGNNILQFNGFAIRNPDGKSTAAGMDGHGVAGDHNVRDEAKTIEKHLHLNAFVP